jgi:hypothetical protein
MRRRQPGKTELTAAQLKPGIGQTAAALYRVIERAYVDKGHRGCFCAPSSPRYSRPWQSGQPSNPLFNGRRKSAALLTAR